ncbi:MAG: hypothetical protein DWQ42_08645, partial [Planctomycetota bacterium]
MHAQDRGRFFVTPSQPAEQTSPQPAQAAPRIAIVGAGVSGLVAAGRLQAGAGKVSIFDKGRGVGGRISTRRTEQGSQFDHGAQYFTVRDARFRRVVKNMQADGVVAPWGGRIAKLERGTITPSSENHERFVGVPTMSAVGKWLARDLPIQLGTRVRNGRKPTSQNPPSRSPTPCSRSSIGSRRLQHSSRRIWP